MSPQIILIVILLYFAVLMIISSITSKHANNQSFFIGNRQSPWYIVAIGMIGASLSGVTFISVPGWVENSQFYYMQMVLGYLVGYAVIVLVLLPLYYRLNLTSIYTYLDKRFGNVSYKTGAVLFLISRLIGASFRLFLVANVLFIVVFNQFDFFNNKLLFGKIELSFVFTVVLTLVLIWVYTYRAGIKTIVWTDTLQTVFMIGAVILSFILISKALGVDLIGAVKLISASEYSAMFDFSSFKPPTYFWKQFLSGAFITIVMTGLDQDMMQKNLSCKNLKDAQKNMLSYSIAFVPVNLIFLSLGALLFIFANQNGIAIPERADDLFPKIATGGLFARNCWDIFYFGINSCCLFQCRLCINSANYLFYG